MGLRKRTSRTYSRQRKERERARRREGLAAKRPHCPQCESKMTAVQGEDRVWDCACGLQFLRVGPNWLVELDPATTIEHELAVAEFLSKAA